MTSNQNPDIADIRLTDLATDCLRLTLRFFRPIQMSAQHIYHTALPLSPCNSILLLRFLRSHPSWKKDRTTWQATLLETSAGWGSVLRTIKVDSGKFTCMAVAGHRIAAACNDNVVNVYDVATGVLRLTLEAPHLVTEVVGSSDGSVLFCSHQRPRKITLWDTQTGSLVHTFTTKFEISDITVSSTGKYLASFSLDGTFRFWEVGSRSGGSRFWDNPVVSTCWLEPEDHIALAFEGTVTVLEMAAGRTLHTFPVGERVQRITYSAGQHRLAIWLTSETGSTIVVIDIRTGSTLVSSPPLMDVVSFTFSGGGDRVVCATKTGDLRFFYIDPLSPPDWCDYLNNLGTIHSISLLRSGQLVANLGGSIQLLGKDYAQPPSTREDPEISHVYPLDNGRAISASSKEREDVRLLDMEIMKTLARYPIPIPPSGRGVSFTPRILCASIDRHVAVLYFWMSGRFTLSVWAIGNEGFKWEEHFSRPVFSGALSPVGEKLIAVVKGSGPSVWEFCLRGVLDSWYYWPTIFSGKPPSKIAFTSETQFYTEVIHVQAPPAPLPEPQDHTKDKDNSKDYIVRKTFALSLIVSHGHVIKEVSEEILNAPYTLDENLEWVVDAKSRRVCWLPPGYVSGIDNGHSFFVGSSIVMAGQDGIVRRLTFRNPYSKS